MKRNARYRALGPREDLAHFPILLPLCFDFNFEVYAKVTKQEKNLVAAKAVEWYLKQNTNPPEVLTFPSVEKVRVTLVIPKRMHEELKKLSQDWGHSVSVLAVECLTKFLQSNGIADPYRDNQQVLLDALCNKKRPR